MRDRYSKGPRRACAVAGALVLMLGAWGGGSALAQNADDEEVPLDTKLLRQFLKDLGLRRDGENIDYHERAPLVVPPSRSLPPPQNEASVANNPAWPRDPDAQQRKLEAAKKKQPARTAAETMDAEGRPLSRSELDRGRLPAGTSSGGSQSPEEGGRALRPSELRGGKNLFSDLFSSFSNTGEVGTFTGEPPRDELTAPPVGYQTPSPEQPYGLSPKNEKAKALTLEQRTSGETR